MGRDRATGQRFRGKEVLLAAALLLPNLVLLAVFTYRPLVDNIRLSFFHWNLGSPRSTFVGWANYAEWFTSEDSRTVLWNTLIFTAAAVVGSMVIGLALALLLDQKLLGRVIDRCRDGVMPRPRQGFVVVTEAPENGVEGIGVDVRQMRVQ